MKIDEDLSVYYILTNEGAFDALCNRYSPDDVDYIFSSGMKLLKAFQIKEEDENILTAFLLYFSSIRSKAKKVIDLNANDKLLAQMMSREKFIRDQQAEEYRKKQLDEKIEKGQRELEEGRRKLQERQRELQERQRKLEEEKAKLESTLKDSKLEIARNMKSLGLDIEVISKTTSLSEEEISKL